MMVWYAFDLYKLLRLQAARTALEKQLEEDLKKAWLMFLKCLFFVCGMCLIFVESDLLKL